MNHLYLRANLAGRDIAVPATHVESVVKVSDVVTVPAVSPHICGLFALRSRVLTVVDCAWFIDGRSRPTADGSLAIVVTIDGHHYGLLVDAVEDIISVEEPPVTATGGLGQGWNNLGREMLHMGDAQSLLVMDITRVVNPQQSLAA